MHTWKPTDWKTLVIIQEKAQEVADYFDVSIKPPSLASFAEVHVHQVRQKDTFWARTQ